MDCNTNGIRLLIVLVLGCAANCGCTSVQLRKSTVCHSMTLEDIYTQQVMNNLALFVQNPDALPFFAYPNQGTTAIQDFGSIGGPGYSTRNFAMAPFSLGANRQASENWVLVPVFEPGKLALMRCAYRQVISSSFGTPLPSDGCLDCAALRRGFYGPDLDPELPHFNELLPCLSGPQWLCCGRKHQIPKDCACPYVGKCGDLYVWVPPEGRDMLTRLTLTILDYAVNSPNQFTKRTKDVELYLNSDGTVNYDGKGIKVTATIPIDTPSKTIASLDRSGDYGRFVTLFGKLSADRILKEVRQIVPKYDQLSPEQQRQYWEKINPDDPVWPADLKPQLEYIQKHGIVPSEIPMDSIYGPGLYERTGSASDGLQQLGQRLSAVSPSSPIAGR